MKICVLGSGSTGNCIYVEAGGTHVIVDAGLTYKATVKGLTALEVSPEALAGILLTHNHIDHSRSADALRRRHGVDLYANEGTASAVEQAYGYDNIKWNIFENGSTFDVGTLKVEAFQVPHDAADTVGFIITGGNEANHDPEMLRQSQRLESVKRRALGRSGHLSNDDAAELLASVLSPRLQAVFMAHLSRDGNTPTLAANALRRILMDAKRDDVRLLQTYPTDMSTLIELT